MIFPSPDYRHGHVERYWRKRPNGVMAVLAVALIWLVVDLVMVMA